MYARRRSVRDAVRLFDEMPERLLNETPTLLQIKPNSLTFLAMLSACCDEGLADEGYKMF
uniref:Pentatricopeptide repeat-containing protein n=1 Tax=Oryza rufipogon TaxID=4529 RepID=A0A0E0Q8H2_ORYRU